MYKKLICIMVFVVVMLGFSAAQASIKIDSYEQKYELLHTLGVVRETMPQKESYTTRAEFIASALRLKYNDTFSGEMTYSDVKKSYPYYDEIMSASCIGLTNGYADGSFMPDKIITPEEAEIILMRVLGFDNFIENEDISVVKTDDVLCGKVDMTWENVAEILCKMLDRKALIPVFGEITKYKESNYTIIEKYRDIYEFDGIFEGIHNLYLKENLFLTEGEVQIGDVQYTCNKDAAEKYVGMRVNGYYHYNKQNDENEILYIQEHNNNVLTINAKDIDDYKNNTLTYAIKNKIHKIKTNVNFDVVYNGVVDVNFKNEDLKIDKGFITLIDNNNDNRYDTALIWEYQIYIINGVNVEDGIIYSKYYSKNYKISLNNSDRNVEMVTDDGTSLDLRELMQNDVICIYESKNKEYVKAIICTKQINGTITLIQEDEDGSSALIDGIEYGISDDCIMNQSEYIKIGVNGVFMLDISGEICNVVTAQDKSYFCYIIKAWVDDSKDVLFIKALTENGDVKIMECSDHVNYDGYTYKDAYAIYDAIGEKDFKPKLAKCAITPEEKVKKIFTADYPLNNGGIERFYTDYDYSTGNPVRVNDGGKHEFSQGGMIINRKVPVSGNTIVMIVPFDAKTTDDRYYICDDTYLYKHNNVYVEGYRTKENGYTADAVIIYDDVSKDHTINSVDTGISVVDKISIAIDDNDEETYMLTIFENGEYKSYLADEADVIDDVYGDYRPTRGDVIRYELKNDKINKFSLVYSAKDEKMVAPVSQTNEFNKNQANIRVWDAYVYYRWDNFMMLSDEKPQMVSVSDVSSMDIHSCNASSIIICENGDRLYSGSPDDIIGYKNTGGDECNKVVVYERWDESKTIVIYR